MKRHVTTPAVPVNEKTAVDHILLASYAPPAVVIDSELRVMQFRGETSGFLRHHSGSASLSLMTLVRGSLAAEIRKLVQERGNKSGTARSKPFALEGFQNAVRVAVTRLDGAPERQFLVVFEEQVPAANRPRSGGKPEKKGSASAERLRFLEEELASTKRYLHSVIEEQEAATEELKSAHEEVQSSNEELQSTNEELLTAKEELQSTNEELTTVNDEMQSRNQELQQSNNDLTNLLSSVNIPIVMLGNDLHIRRFTPHAEKILNLLPSDVGRPVSDFRLKITVPDLMQLCQEVIDTLVPREREVQDVEGRLYSMWVRPYRTADNRIAGVVLALLDITDRKQAAETRFQRLFEAAADGIIIADARTGEILDSNPFVTRLFGYPRSRLVGVKYWNSDLFRGSGMDESFGDELKSREPIQRTLSLLTESGAQLPLEITASLYSEGEREVIQFNIRDISVRKRIEEDLARAQESLGETQKLETVARLAGGVAHDFNNILTVVAGYADLLRKRIHADDAALEMVNQIRSGADRAIAVTRQLLAFGRNQVVSPAALDLSVVIRDLRQMLAVMLPKEIEVRLELQPDLARIWADRGQIEQVLMNLVLNARDAMREGGVLTITAANAEVDRAFAQRHRAIPPGQYVSLTVQDTGAGMDEETQAHMFEPFFSTKPKGNGLGLGLSTVYAAVKESNGYIRAYSELGAGTTFTLYFPRYEEQPAAEKTAAPKLDGTETILLVEDDHVVRELARRFLVSHGYRVLEASQSAEALQLARGDAGPIQLMVTDVALPRMSGRELALQLAPERPEMRVLYVSGHAEDTIALHGILQPGVEFLRKPFSEQDFISRVRAILDKPAESGNRE